MRTWDMLVAGALPHDPDGAEDAISNGLSLFLDLLGKVVLQTDLLDQL